jgi:hypothetical protein
MRKWRMSNSKQNHIWGRFSASALFSRGDSISSAWQVIGWWESRRIPYNLIVGSAGLISCVVVGAAALASEILFGKEFGLPDPPIFAIIGILIYGLIANVCFTGGWIVELILRKLWPLTADQFAPSIFKLGLIFSVLLTLAPAMVISALGVIGIARHLLGSARG